MTKEQKLNLMRETGLIAIMRADGSDQLIAAADAIRAGGIRAIEVTMTTPGAIETIRAARHRYRGETLFGAGTVLDPETAGAAILAGADFVVAPTFDPKMVAICRRYSIPVFPGCFTPTEMLTAWEGGASMIKLFPADLGGPSYIKAVRAPLPQLEIVPVGGVNLDTAAEFIRSGAAVLGVGSSLINQKLLEAGNMEDLRHRAAAFVAEVAKGRNS